MIGKVIGFKQCNTIDAEAARIPWKDDVKTSAALSNISSSSVIGSISAHILINACACSAVVLF